MPCHEDLIQALGRPADLIHRSLPSPGLEVVFLNTLVDAKRAEKHVIHPLLGTPGPRSHEPDEVLRWISDRTYIGSVRTACDLQDAARAVTEGYAAICAPSGTVVLVHTKGHEHRAPSEPTTELSIRGPRDSFSELLQVNLSLLRARMRNPQLQAEQFTLGTETHTEVVLVYHAALAAPWLVEKVRARLQTVKTDRVLETADIEQYIEDRPYSPYPQIQSTERPDKVIAALLEGRVAILVDGTPFALLAPAVLASFFQTTDDYSQRWFTGTAIRLLRVLALGVSLLGPSMYVAMSRFSPELMPLKMALSLSASREGIPFPIVVEALIMEAMVELLREAGSRIPRLLGQSMSIVGGLVIGEIAVRAGLVSPIMVIVVGLTALGSFAIPSYEAALVTRLLRFPMLVVTGVFGVAGAVVFMLTMWAHLSTLTSMGVPYLTPFAQLSYREWRDTFVRAPLPLLKWRPSTYGGRSRRRPSPPKRRR